MKSVSLGISGFFIDELIWLKLVKDLSVANKLKVFSKEAPWNRSNVSGCLPARSASPSQTVLV